MSEVTGISEVSEKQKPLVRGLSKSEKLAVLQRWEKVMSETDIYLTHLNALAGLSTEGGLLAAFLDLMDAYTGNTAKLVGDTEGLLDWYWTENGMGAKGMEAGYDDDERPIRTVEDLLWLIEEV